MSESTERKRTTEITVLQFKPSEACEARIELRGDVTREAIETLIALLKTQKRVFPKKSATWSI